MNPIESDVLRDLLLLSVGAVLGFASSVAVNLIQRRNRKRDQEDRVTTLAARLAEEVEQAAELLAIDLRIESPTPLSLLFGDDQDLPAKLRSALKRLRGCRTIYDAYAGDLIHLPNSAAKSLARFHNRLPAQCDEMEAALDREDYTAFSQAGQNSLTEAEIVKRELRSATG